MSLSSFEEKFDERNTTTFCHQKTKKKKTKKKKVPRMMMESRQRKIEEKFSFRVLYQKKRSSAFTSPSQERTTKRALEGVCVCVCVDLERRE